MVLRHEVRTWRNARRSCRVARARSRPTRGFRAGRRDRRVRACGGHRPPGSETVERHGRTVRRGARARLGRGPSTRASGSRWRPGGTRGRPSSGRRGRRDLGRNAPGYRGLHGAGTGAWRFVQRRTAGRCLCARRAGPPAPSKRLAAIIRTCLSPAPADRYASAKELVDDLARYRQGAAVSAYRETALERAGRWLIRYQTFVWLVLSYLVMRVAFALLR